MRFLVISGLVPIAIVLVSIFRYGPQSWYIIVLSIGTYLLASTRLVVDAIGFSAMQEHSGFDFEGISRDYSAVSLSTIFLS